jgi:hypothetical protein
LKKQPLRRVKNNRPIGINFAPKDYMKMFNKLILTLAAISFASFNVEAAQTERAINFALTGFVQTNNLVGPVVSPFRVTTRDILVEIGLTTGQDFTFGSLLLVESVDDTNIPPKVVARKLTNQLDVSEFFPFMATESFPFQYGEAVATETATRGTFYGIDHFEFSTLAADTNGFALEFQGFSRETLVAVTKFIGTTPVPLISGNLRSDGNGEMRFLDDLGTNSFFGPVKGNIRIGPPKLVP